MEHKGLDLDLAFSHSLADLEVWQLTYLNYINYLLN